MSRAVDEKHYNGRGGQNKRSVPEVKQFFSVYPTAAEKDYLRGLSWGPLEALETLQAKVNEGLSFTLTATQTGDALCLVVRQRSASYGQGQALSFFHSDPGRLLVLAAWALTERYPEWPGKPVTNAQQAFDF